MSKLGLDPATQDELEAIKKNAQLKELEGIAKIISKITIKKDITRDNETLSAKAKLKIVQDNFTKIMDEIKKINKSGAEIEAGLGVDGYLREINKNLAAAIPLIQQLKSTLRDNENLAKIDFEQVKKISKNISNMLPPGYDKPMEVVREMENIAKSKGQNLENLAKEKPGRFFNEVARDLDQRIHDDSFFSSGDLYEGLKSLMDSKKPFFNQQDVSDITKLLDDIDLVFTSDPDFDSYMKEKEASMSPKDFNQYKNQLLQAFRFKLMTNAADELQKIKYKGQDTKINVVSATNTFMQGINGIYPDKDKNGIYSDKDKNKIYEAVQDYKKKDKIDIYLQEKKDKYILEKVMMKGLETALKEGNNTKINEAIETINRYGIISVSDVVDYLERKNNKADADKLKAVAGIQTPATAPSTPTASPTVATAAPSTPTSASPTVAGKTPATAPTIPPGAIKPPPDSAPPPLPPGIQPPKTAASATTPTASPTVAAAAQTPATAPSAPTASPTVAAAAPSTPTASPAVAAAPSTPKAPTVAASATKPPGRFARAWAALKSGKVWKAVKTLFSPKRAAALPIVAATAPSTQVSGQPSIPSAPQSSGTTTKPAVSPVQLPPSPQLPQLPQSSPPSKLNLSPISESPPVFAPRFQKQNQDNKVSHTASHTAGQSLTPDLRHHVVLPIYDLEKELQAITDTREQQYTQLPLEFLKELKKLVSGEEGKKVANDPKALSKLVSDAYDEFYMKKFIPSKDPNDTAGTKSRDDYMNKVNDLVGNIAKELVKPDKGKKLG